MLELEVQIEALVWIGNKDTDLTILELWSWECEVFAVEVNNELIIKVECEKGILEIGVVIELVLALDSIALVWFIDIEELMNDDLIEVEDGNTTE